MEINKEMYGAYVKQITPTHNKWINLLWAFVTGGMICAAGQLLFNTFLSWGMEKEEAAAWELLSLIAVSALLTGLNIYQNIVKFAGAGALVPITGFANSVAAPAMEFKAEGNVFGTGCKIFTIAGPVILYGIFSSWILGGVWCILKYFGIY